MGKMNIAVAIAGRSATKGITRLKTFELPRDDPQAKKQEMSSYLDRLDSLGIDNIRVAIFGNDRPGAEDSTSEHLMKELTSVFDRPTVTVDA